jgi:hypothetical protein
MRALGSLPEAFRKIEREQGKRGVLSEDEFLHLALELSPQREVPPLPLLSISYPLIISLLPFTDTIFFFLLPSLVTLFIFSSFRSFYSLLVLLPDIRNLKFVRVLFSAGKLMKPPLPLLCP